jgi:hypothetical protein
MTLREVKNDIVEGKEGQYARYEQFIEALHKIQMAYF